MKRTTIAVIIGSLRKESINRKLATVLMKLSSPEFELKIINISNLPLYNQDDEEKPQDSVREFRNEVEKFDGLLFVTPEYNRSIPGVLKNALDIGSRPYGKSIWAGKPAGVIGISTGAIGTAVAQQHLRNILTFLNVPVMNQPEAFIQYKEGLFTETGEISESSRQFLQNWMEHFEGWVKRFSD